MDFWHWVMEILMLLGTAFALGFLAQKLKQSAIVGYLLAGVILGPILFNREAVNSVAELGVDLLLFSIGLEFSFRRLLRMGSIALGGGSLQVIITLILYASLFLIKYPVNVSLVFGSAAALSSTAVVLRVLADRMEMDSVRGRNALGILLLQDIAVVPLVLFITMLGAGGEPSEILLGLGKTAAAALGLIAFYYLLFYHLMPRFLFSKGLFSNRELVVLLAILMAIGSIYLSHVIGLSAALGAFLAGMFLAESPFAVQIRSDIGALRTLFVTLFFTSIGMLFNPEWFMNNWMAVFFWLVMVMVGKTAVVYAVCRILKVNPLQSLATGFTLAQIGEFSFVLATIASAEGLISQDVFNLIVGIAILSLFFAPFMVSFAIPVAGAVIRKILPGSRSGFSKAEDEEGLPERKVFIIGFGPAGERVAEALTDLNLKIEVIELNPSTAASAQQMGLKVHLGDAADGEVLLHAGLKGLCVAVVTVPDPRMSKRIIEQIRHLNPKIAVIARSRYHMTKWELRDAGADVIVDEENTTGRTLAQETVNLLSQGCKDAMTCALTGVEHPTLSSAKDVDSF
ncbi:MAG: cation:proton antiporter [Thermodesulfobacteriota bacterium]